MDPGVAMDLAMVMVLVGKDTTSMATMGVTVSAFCSQ